MKITVEFDSLAEFESFRATTPTPVVPTPAPVPAPTPSPIPAPAAPLVRMLNMPARAVPGTLRWAVDGTTFMAAVVTNGDIIIAGLYSASGTGDGLQMARLESMLDSGLDTKPPETTTRGLRDWLESRIVPALNAWFFAGPDRMNGAVFTAVSSAPIPADWSVFDRAAASLAQCVKFGPTGFEMA